MPDPSSSSKTTPIPIRFDGSVKERLQAVSADCGLSVSDLCRLAVEKLLVELEQTGKITLRVSEEVSGYHATPKAPQKPKARGKGKGKSKTKK